MVYHWREEAPFAGRANANDVGQRLERVRRQSGGTLHVADVVADARDAASPTHPLFEWNDSVAASRYRKHQADELIRSIVVVACDASTGAAAPAFVRVAATDAPHERRYTSAPVAVLAARPAPAATVESRALRELRDWRRRYGEVPTLGALCRTIDEHIRRLASAESEAA